MLRRRAHRSAIGGSTSVERSCRAYARGSRPGALPLIRVAARARRVGGSPPRERDARRPRTTPILTVEPANERKLAIQRVSASQRSQPRRGLSCIHQVRWRLLLRSGARVLRLGTPERGGPDLHDGEDYFHAFETYEDALRVAQATPGAEEPLVLVRQHEHVDEPAPGRFEHVRGERLTEWRVEWLDGSKREPNSIPAFLRAHAGSS